MVFPHIYATLFFHFWEREVQRFVWYRCFIGENVLRVGDALLMLSFYIIFKRKSGLFNSFTVFTR